MKLYNKKMAASSNNSSETESKSNMDVDIQKTDKAIQTDPLIESPPRNIIAAEVKSISTNTTPTSSFDTFHSLALPFFR
jgi:hypothetical protein